jgi:hypothetical protein
VVESREEAAEVSAGELPLEWRRDLLGVAAEDRQPLLECGELAETPCYRTVDDVVGKVRGSRRRQSKEARMHAARPLGLTALIAALVCGAAGATAPATRAAQTTPSLEIPLDPTDATALDAGTSTATGSLGETVLVRAEDSSEPQSYLWHVSLAPGESLEPLVGGSVAIVRPWDATGEEDGLTADEIATMDDTGTATMSTSGTATSTTSTSPAMSGDASFDSPVTSDETIVTLDATSAFEGLESTQPADASGTTADPDMEDDAGYPNPPDADTDEPEYELGDQGADDAGGADAVIAAAQEQVLGEVVAVVTAPSAYDAAGQAVPASFSLGVDSMTLGLASTGASYPVSASAQIVSNPDLSAAATSGPIYTPASCPTLARIVTWNPRGFAKLIAKLTAYPTSCARYYVTAPLFADPSRKRVLRANAATIIHSKNSLASVRNARSRFFALAEFHWQGWGMDTATVAQARQAGQDFRREMFRKGYLARYGDRWAINEVPRDVVSSQTTRNRLMALLEGLYYGPNDNYTPMRGVIFETFFTQSPRTVSKDDVKSWSLDAGFWQTMNRFVLFWGQESYPYCEKVCVPSTRVGDKARHTNAYTQFHPRLVFAPNAPAASLEDIRRFFDRAYFPLLSGFWKGADYHTTSAYGMSGARMQRFVSLQTYANRSWSTRNRYPDRRIGFAWNDNPAGATLAQTRALAQRVARSLRGAYSLNGTPRYACAPDGSSITLCNPVMTTPFPATFTEEWATFASWP